MNKLSSGAVCCFHDGDAVSSEPITTFNEKSLTKCRIVLQRRKEKDLKYSNVTLPIAAKSKEGYHISCYRKFIALPKNHRIEELCEKQLKGSERTKRSLDTTSSNNGIWKPICFFCNQSRKRSAGKTEFVTKELKYHGVCRVKYQKKAEYASGQKKNQRGHWHLERERYADAFAALANQVEEDVIRGKQVYRLNDLLRMYQSIIREDSDEFKDTTLAYQHLKDKLCKHFGERIRLEKCESIKGILAFLLLYLLWKQSKPTIYQKKRSSPNILLLLY